MSDTKFTPGPWHAEGPYVNHNGVRDLWEVCWTPDGECVAETVHGISNAHLIAAAPELYEALREISEAVEGFELALFEKAVGKAKAALSKARGEQ